MAVRDSVETAGLLFQKAPDIGAWKPTRPGLGSEQSAWKNPELDDWHRLSLNFHAEGEVDENDVEYEEDTWVVEQRGIGLGNGGDARDWYTDREEALERVREIMEANA